MKRCNGRPSEALRRIEAAAGGGPVDTNRVYRAMRRPMRFPVKFAQLVVTASGGECSLVELMDLDTIAAHFEYGDPDLHCVSLRLRIVKLERRLRAVTGHYDRAAATLDAVTTELDECRRKLAELEAAAPLTAAAV